jgi:anti-sigma regulatory factor (Ser/Thr protein kinase)
MTDDAFVAWPPPAAGVAWPPPAAGSEWPPPAAGSEWPPPAAGPTEPAGTVGWADQAGALTLLLDQEFDSRTLYALRAAVQALATRAGLSEDRTVEVVLAVHELAANAIAHGAGHGRLRMWHLADVLSCEIVDGGRSGSADSAETPDPWPVVDGHGLWLVRQVADRLDLSSGPDGTRAVIIFALPDHS